ncbi:expressed unknown protein [Seminavis robusta]|uniref:Uncharacterized protein n=1 Tax=Seminavis robusta TaxID=568900 RepID=A0A9N8HWU1_9STRA|nr:expressed unknown protein [Seminavis robusta]|eukprot:Sro1699_g292010.1 n/a (130) ;mRNA; f:5152-5541
MCRASSKQIPKIIYCDMKKKQPEVHHEPLEEEITATYLSSSVRNDDEDMDTSSNSRWDDMASPRLPKLPNRHMRRLPPHEENRIVEAASEFLEWPSGAVHPPTPNVGVHPVRANDSTFLEVRWKDDSGV